MARRLLIWFWNQPKETFLNVHSSTGICRGRGTTAPRRQDNKYTSHLEALQPALLFPGRRGCGPASPRLVPCRRAGVTGGLPSTARLQRLLWPPGHQRATFSVGCGSGPSRSAGVGSAVVRPPASCIFVATGIYFILFFFKLKFCREWGKKCPESLFSLTLRSGRVKSGKRKEVS